MGLFVRIWRLFVKPEPTIESENEQVDFEQEEYANKYQGNNERISTSAMDTLLLDEEESDAVESVVISEYDAGDVDFDVFEKIQDGSLQSLYSAVHYGGDQFQDAFIVHNTSSIVIHLNGEEIFSNEKTDIDE